MKRFLILISIAFAVFTSCTKDGDTSGDDPDKPAFEIWMGQKAGSTGNFANLRWMVVLPDGDYFNQLPADGFLNFPKNQTGGTRGTYTMNGNLGTFVNQYESLNVKRLSDSEMEIQGYSHHLYKLSPVDGVKLSGSYNTIPNWSTTPDYQYGPSDAQPMITFNANGTFKDQGAFVTNFSMPNQDPQRAPGIGNYEIKNFTLVLNYSDGRKITKSFSGVFNNKVTAISEMVFIAANPFYNK